MTPGKQLKLLVALGALTFSVSACGDSNENGKSNLSAGDAGSVSDLDGAASSGNADAGSGNADAGSGNGDASSGEGDASTSDGALGTEDGSVGDGGRSKGDGDGYDPDAGGGGLTPLAANTAGKACSADKECGPGTCSETLTGGSLLSLISGFSGLDPSMSVEGGYCTLPCLKDADCGQGGVCFGLPPSLLAGLPGNEGECREKCSAKRACTRSGFECATLDKDAAADPVRGLGGAGGGDTSALDPSQIWGFVQLPSSCVPKPIPDQMKDGEVGKACRNDDDCGEGTCNGATADANGSCTGLCAQDATCGAGAVCGGKFYGSRGQCIETCTTAADCARADEGFTCEIVGSGETAVGICRTPSSQSVTDAGADASATTN